MSTVGPDLTTNTYYIDRQSDEYASALRKNAYNQQMVHNGSGSLSPSPVPALQPLTISLANSHSGLNHVNYIGGGQYEHSLSVRFNLAL